MVDNNKLAACSLTAVIEMVKVCMMKKLKLEGIIGLFMRNGSILCFISLKIKALNLLDFLQNKNQHFKQFYIIISAMYKLI